MHSQLPRFLVEHFSLGAFVLSQYTRLTDGRTDGQNLDSNTVRMLRSRTVKARRYYHLWYYTSMVFDGELSISMLSVENVSLTLTFAPVTLKT